MVKGKDADALSRTRRLLTVRLLLVVAVMVPSLAVGFYAAGDYRDAVERSERAARVEEAIDLSSRLRLLSMWLDADAEIEFLQSRLLPIGLDLRQLDEITGAGETRDALAIARALAMAELTDLRTAAAGSRWFGDDTIAVLDGLDGLSELHASVDRGEASSDYIAEWFDVQGAAVDRHADDLIGAIRVEADTGTLFEQAQAIESLSKMLSSSVQEVYGSVGVLTTIPQVSPDPQRLLTYATVRANADEAERQFLELASPDALALWNEGLEDPLVQQWEAYRAVAPIWLGLVTPEPGAEPASVDPIVYGGVGFDQAVLRSELLRDVAALAARDAASLRSAAEDGQRQALWQAGLVSFITMLGCLLVAQAILIPLRRLARRADEVSAGHLDVEPLGASGPAEVAGVAVTLDAMVSTLQRTNTQLNALAEGRVDAPELADHLPGPLGRNVRQSIGALQDVTRKLQASEAAATAVVGNAAEGILTVTLSGTVTRVNPAAQRLLQLPALAIEGTLLETHLDPGQRRELDQLLDQAAAGHPGREDFTLGARAEHREVAISVSLHEGSDDMTVIITDMSAERRFTRELQHQAHTDGLTGLYNRSGALQFLENELHSCTETRPLAVLFGDLDRFKTINDALGHGAGDEALRRVAAVLTRIVGTRGCVGRIGGDEFIAILRDTDEEAALAIGRSLAHAIGGLEVASDQTLSVGFSVGIAVTRDPDTTTSSLLSDADLALFAAKGAIDAVQVCDDLLRSTALRRRQLEHSLTEAIGTDALELWLQPVVDLESGMIASAEALARWTLDGQSVSPGEFITVAESSSLIIDFDRWALFEVCRMIVEIERRTGCPTPVAVNVSWRHLRDADLYADVVAALEASGCDPALLRIELTESSEPLDSEEGRACLHRLRAMGVGLSLDDFGTGYTSINQLRRMPFDTVKIDRSLVIEPDRGAGESLVDVVMQLGQILDLSVVGEGVEEAVHLDRLRHAGCRLGQGWLWSRAVPMGDFCALLDSWPGVAAAPIVR